MPQMSPISWTIMFMFIIFLMSMNLSKTFFQFANNNLKKLFKKEKINKILWKW
uniref:ATP synthase F0 subunit 8 n=1 Tax=Novacerus sp. FZ-2019 TaxID=2585224 RepID=A0A6H0EWV7_9HEXA|nr:ATP synthase F0 subunit 8 [Novacerus sp. FZ-2019]